MKKLKEFRTFKWLVKMEDHSHNIIIQVLPIVGIEIIPGIKQAEGCVLHIFSSFS
jgi:hypothetical protein